METTSFGGRDGNPDLRARASELLLRYPQIEEHELTELHHFYNTSPAIDTALLTCEPVLVPKIAQFLHEQRRALRHQAKLGMLMFTLYLSLALIAYAIWAGM